MWMKQTRSGDYIVESDGVTWLTSELKELTRVGLFDPWKSAWIYLPPLPDGCRYHHFRRMRSMVGIGSIPTGPDPIVAEFLVIEDQDGNYPHGVKIDYIKKGIKVW